MRVAHASLVNAALLSSFVGPKIVACTQRFLYTHKDYYSWTDVAAWPPEQIMCFVCTSNCITLNSSVRSCEAMCEECVNIKKEIEVPLPSPPHPPPFFFAITPTHLSKFPQWAITTYEWTGDKLLLPSTLDHLSSPSLSAVPFPQFVPRSQMKPSLISREDPVSTRLPAAELVVWMGNKEKGNNLHLPQKKSLGKKKVAAVSTSQQSLDLCYCGFSSSVSQLPPDPMVQS